MEVIGNPSHDIDALFAPKNNKIKVKHGEKILSTEPYAKELYMMITGMAEPKIGHVIDALPISKVGNDLVLSTNHKSDVVIHLSSKEMKYLTKMPLDQSMKVVITDIDENCGMIASVSDYFAIEYALKIQECVKTGEPIQVVINKMTKSGYFADYHGVTLFISNYDIDVNKVPHPEEWVGRTIDVLVTEWAKDFKCYQASRKKWLEIQAEQVVKTLVKGQKYTGFVTGTTSFGIFVQLLGCLTGLIHKQNVIEENKDTFQSITPGDEIDFYYRETLNSGKIILTQVWQDSIWDTVELGAVYDAVVENDNKFGAMARLDWDTVGLVSENEQKKSGQKLVAGQKIKVKVSSIIRGEKKMNFMIV